MTTKEEWKLGTGNIATVVEANSGKVAIVYGNSDEEELANAYLIVAAPQMYEALKECLILIEDLMPGVANIALQNYKRLNDAPIAGCRALAKADGKE